MGRITKSEREERADKIRQAGEVLTEVRESLMDKAPYVAGMMRGTEEALTLAYKMLMESDDSEL